MVSEIVHRLDATLHERSRLSIATTLWEHGILSFAQLKKLLGMTDGNLCIHMRTLERKGYLRRSKRFRKGKPQTQCRLSEKGKKALHAYIDDMERLVSTVRAGGTMRAQSHENRLE